MVTRIKRKRVGAQRLCASRIKRGADLKDHMNLWLRINSFADVASTSHLNGSKSQTTTLPTHSVQRPASSVDDSSLTRLNFLCFFFFPFSKFWRLVWSPRKCRSPRTPRLSSLAKPYPCQRTAMLRSAQVMLETLALLLPVKMVLKKKLRRYIIEGEVFMALIVCESETDASWKKENELMGQIQF